MLYASQLRRRRRRRRLPEEFLFRRGSRIFHTLPPAHMGKYYRFSFLFAGTLKQLTAQAEVSCFLVSPPPPLFSNLASIVKPLRAKIWLLQLSQDFSFDNNLEPLSSTSFQTWSVEAFREMDSKGIKIACLRRYLFRHRCVQVAFWKDFNQKIRDR